MRNCELIRPPTHGPVSCMVDSKTGRFMLVFLLSVVVGSEDGHSATLWPLRWKVWGVGWVSAPQVTIRVTIQQHAEKGPKVETVLMPGRASAECVASFRQAPLQGFQKLRAHFGRPSKKVKKYIGVYLGAPFSWKSPYEEQPGYTTSCTILQPRKTRKPCPKSRPPLRHQAHTWRTSKPAIT